jgi:signal transduction histidine kinase
MLPDERTTRSVTPALPTEVEALVVAPGRGVARPVVAFLRQQNINVQITDDADSAFEEALIHPPDVVFVDDRIGPPGGVDLCQRLKSNVRTHFVPTIVLVLNDLPQLRLRALAAGADAVFAPSTDPRERRTRLWSLLRTRALYRQIDRRQRSQGSEIVERRRWLAYLLHDLQGSVAALRANVDYMARRGPPPGDVRRGDFDEAVEDARTVFDQLMQSVRTVIDFDRFESGQLTIEAGPVKLGELAEGVAEDLRRHPLILSGERSLDIVRPADELAVAADPELMRRVLVNLTLYCLRRADAKTTVHVSHTEGAVRLWIGCSGRTPSAVEKRDMFEPYAQLGDRPVGYGLGLALARAVVELHRGRIWIEDVPGGGFAFVATLGTAAPDGEGPRRGRRRSRG